MMIKINEQYAIGSDSRSWQVKEFRQVKNKETGEIENRWDSLTWHGSFDQAIDSLCQRLLRSADCSTIQELRDAAQEIKETLREASKAGCLVH